MELTANFIVISKKTRTTRTFDTESQVHAFMLGRRLSDWAIYQLKTDGPWHAPTPKTSTILGDSVAK